MENSAWFVYGAFRSVLNLVFAAMGAIKGILNQGIITLDEKREHILPQWGKDPAIRSA